MTLVPQSSGSWGTPWATGTSWEVAPAGLGAPVLGVHPGRETSSPAFPGCGQGDVPAPRTLGADTSVSGKPARVGVLVSSGCCNKHHRRSLSPGLEAGTPDPGVGGAGPPEAPLLGVQTAGSSPSPPRVVAECVCVLTSSSCKDPSPVGSGPHPGDLILPEPPFEDPVSKYSHILRSWGSGPQHRALGDAVSHDHDLGPPAQREDSSVGSWGVFLFLFPARPKCL